MRALAGELGRWKTEHDPHIECFTSWRTWGPN